MQGPFLAYIVAFPHCEKEASNGNTMSNFRLFSHFNPVRPWDLQEVQANFSYKVALTDENWVSFAALSSGQGVPRSQYRTLSME